MKTKVTYQVVTPTHIAYESKSFNSCRKELGILKERWPNKEFQIIKITEEIVLCA